MPLFSTALEVLRSATMTSLRHIALLLLALALLVLGLKESRAQEEKSETPAETSHGELLRRLLNKVDELERDLKTVLKNAPQGIPADAADQKLVPLLETPVVQTFYLGSRNGQPLEHRLFVAKLTLINLTPQAKLIEPSHITLDSDGNVLKNGVLDQQIQNFGISIGQQGYSLSQLKPTPVKVGSGQTGTTWIVFDGLPRGPGLPRLKLNINDGGQAVVLDINGWAAKQLDIASKRLGPRGCLALLTIGGELNGISLGALVDELDRLSAQKVARVVIRWAEGAPPIEQNLSHQFFQMVQNLGRSEFNNPQLPTLPHTFSEFHLAEVPAANQAQAGIPPNAGEPLPGLSSTAVVHRTTIAAVTAALRTAYEVVSRNELLDDIRTGDSLTRAAALSTGGGRLAAEHLPMILQLCDDDDPQIQYAALNALRHFGEPEAVAKLLDYARKNKEPLASTAIASLASSRYAASHEALLQVLENEGGESRKTIVKVLAQYPRPIWSETIYKYVRDPQSGLGVDGLQALVRVGHPKLVEVLTEALASHDTRIRDAAFNELVNLPDAASERVALQFTLKHLNTLPPTPAMLNLLTKTKDQSSVPLLLKHLQNPNTDRSGIINTLAQIGDQTIAEAIVEQYATLRPHEQSTLLGVLGQLKSPTFLKLAEKALKSSDASVLSTTCQWLQNDGSQSAVKLLAEAFDKSDNPTTITYTSNALGQLGTAEARVALRKGRSSTNPHKQAQARNALQILYQRSPAMQFIYQARNLAQQKQDKEAVELYDQAVKTDPELPDAYLGRAVSLNRLEKYPEALKDYNKVIELDDTFIPAYNGRANVLVRQNKYSEAKKDFEKVMTQDTPNGEGVTGVGICLAVEGKFEDGIKLVEEARAKYAGNGLFAYNVACVYGRAIEQLKKDEHAPDRDKKLAAFRQRAIEDLRASVKQGFNDFDWMQKDPDLKSLHDLPEFQELVTKKSG
jgi:tetratricopeptide (TPR) repeat protein